MGMGSLPKSSTKTNKTWTRLCILKVVPIPDFRRKSTLKALQHSIALKIKTSKEFLVIRHKARDSMTNPKIDSQSSVHMFEVSDWALGFPFEAQKEWMFEPVLGNRRIEDLCHCPQSKMECSFQGVTKQKLSLQYRFKQLSHLRLVPALDSR